MTDDTEVLTVHAYDAVTGRHIMRVPYTACSWSQSINEPGSMNTNVSWSTQSDQAASLLLDRLRPWKAILAIQQGPANILHAGPITSRQWDSSGRKLSFTCGGGWTLLGRRLVLGHGLASNFHDGDVLIDEEHPVDDWALTLTGSYQDIIRGLIAETLKWGPLPFTLPAVEGGAYSRTYYGWDLATVADRIADIADLQTGMEIRFTPHVNSQGILSFQLEAAHELTDHWWTWNTTLPGQRVMCTSYKDDGADIANDVWAAGGKDDDRTIMARATNPEPIAAGYPLLQAANTEHTTISILSTLQSYASAQATNDTTAGETWELKTGTEWPVHVGDWADVRLDDPLLGRHIAKLKITDISGSTESDWLTIQARSRPS